MNPRTRAPLGPPLPRPGSPSTGRGPQGRRQPPQFRRTRPRPWGFLSLESLRGSFARPLPDLSKNPHLFAIVFGVLAAGLATAGSWIPSLWGDEAASILSATRSTPSLLAMLTHVDAVHGSYYLGLHGWIAVFGASPFSVRVPSALAVGAGAAATVTLARMLGTTRLSVAVGLVYCVLPRVTYMGEEARAYAFDAAIAAWLLVLLVRLIRDPAPRRRWWIAYSALLALGVYVFLYLGLMIAAHAVVLAAGPGPHRRYRRAAKRWDGRAGGSAATWRRWALATGAALVAASPVAVLAVLERNQIAFLSSTTTTDFASLTVGVWFSRPSVAIAAWALIGIGLAPLARGAWRGKSLELVAAAWLVVPGGLLLLSNLAFADFSGRYLSMSAPAAALAMGLGIDRLGRIRPALAVVATALVVALCVPVYLAQRTPYAKNGSDWSEVSATMRAHASPGQAVVFDETVRPSRRTRLAMHTYPAGFAGLRDVGLKTPWTSSTTWYDRAYSVPQALELGRFRGVTTVWLIEYSDSTGTDTYGRADLEAAGFRFTAQYRTHRAVILRLDRP